MYTHIRAPTSLIVMMGRIRVVISVFFPPGAHSTGGLCRVGHHRQHPEWLERRLGPLNYLSRKIITAQIIIIIFLLLFFFLRFVSAFPAEPSFCLPKCLMEKVNSGHYGRKSGQGFYVWEGDKALRVA